MIVNHRTYTITPPAMPTRPLRIIGAGPKAWRGRSGLFQQGCSSQGCSSRACACAIQSSRSIRPFRSSAASNASTAAGSRAAIAAKLSMPCASNLRAIAGPIPRIRCRSSCGSGSGSGSGSAARAARAGAGEASSEAGSTGCGVGAAASFAATETGALPEGLRRGYRGRARVRGRSAVQPSSPQPLPRPELPRHSPASNPQGRTSVAWCAIRTRPAKTMRPSGLWTLALGRPCPAHRPWFPANSATIDRRRATALPD